MRTAHTHTHIMTEHTVLPKILGAKLEAATPMCWSDVRELAFPVATAVTNSPTWTKKKANDGKIQLDVDHIPRMVKCAASENPPAARLHLQHRKLVPGGSARRSSLDVHKV